MRLSEKNTIGSYLQITLGVIIYSFSLSAFLIPGKIIGGGLSGISTIIYYSTGLPVGVSYFAINILLLLAAVKILGASFGIKALYAMGLTSVLLSFLPSYFLSPLVEDLFMITIVGSILGGIGIGMIIAAGATTGGTEIVALVVNHYRNISPGRILLLLDLVIITSSYLTFRSVEKLMYGYVQMVALSYMVDMYLEGARESVQITLFSKYYEEIADRITKEVNRGLTVMKGIGWFTKEEVSPIIIIARRQELTIIMGIIKEVDEHAFVSVAKVMGVFGQGFDRIKL